jgi:hypothetical protein
MWRRWKQRRSASANVDAANGRSRGFVIRRRDNGDDGVDDESHMVDDRCDVLHCRWRMDGTAIDDWFGHRHR